MLLKAKTEVKGMNVEMIQAQYEKNNPAKNAQSLREAFDFDNTKEGRPYWELIDKLFKLEPEPMDKVETQLSVLPEDIREGVLEELHKVDYRKNKELKFAFKWGESPQGANFWKTVAHLVKVYRNGHLKHEDTV